MTQAMKFFDPPPVRYFGSKWQLAEWIIAQMPPHEVYVEPYCGGASVFFRKEPSALEALNDLNGDVLNFFDVLRSREAELIRAIDLTPYSLAEFKRAGEPSEDELERARRFYVRAYQSVGGGGAGRRAGGWRRVYDLKRGSTPGHDWSRLEGLYKAAQRLKEAQLECEDALDVIKRYDSPDTLFYVDPPYVMDSCKDKRNVYVHEIDDEQQRQLADVLHHIKGMVLLSGYDSPLYQELYSDWTVATKTNTTNGNSQSVEYLWSSPNATRMDRLPLFAGL